MATITTGHNAPTGFTSGEVVTATKLNAHVNSATVTDIVNADIKSDAAIAGSKLADGAITNAKVDAAAAIAGTKIAPDFGAQDVVVGSSGQVLPTTGSVDGVTLEQSGYVAISRDDLVCLFLRRRSGDGDIAVFRRDTTKVGSIAVTTTATTYNTSSDYRLKQNVEPMVGGLVKLAQLKPSTFEFKSDPSTKVDGFIAHEVQAIVPQAVTGEKDGEEMQGLDMSKLVPVLVAAVQELSVKVAALEAAQ